MEVKRHEAKLRSNVQVQPTQDNRANKVNKLESGTTTTRLASQHKDKPLHHKRQEKANKDLKHIQCFKRSNIGHYGFMCSTQVGSKTRLSRRQRKIMNVIVCFECKNEGHRILSCPNFQAEPVIPDF
jgi:hypothetical protein